MKIGYLATCAALAMVIAIAAVSALLPIARARADEVKPATDGPKPLAPDEAVRHFEVEPGFRVELFAAEPHLTDPVAMTFDADGRLFACEIHGYNLEGQLDVDELNKSGKLDMAVRRIPAPPWAVDEALRQTYGTVKCLVDDDGDGRADRSTIFADKLPACYGIAPAGDGVIVVAAPEIIYLGDRDGDGKAEIRETLFTGFNEGEMWSRANNVIWGEDNWLYVCGGRGEPTTITGKKLKSPVKLGAVSFRFKPDGTALEPITGNAGGFGLTMSDWGDRFSINNSVNGLQIIPLPYHYLARNPNVPSPSVFHNATTNDRLHVISEQHPWRKARLERPEWRKFYGERTSAPGFLTSACGSTFYRGETFGVEYAGNFFCCDPQQNVVNRTTVDRRGTKLFLMPPKDHPPREFLASRDQWFRPVNLATGPDGDLYVVDMYREIIEDYSAVPRFMQQQYGLIKGQDRGRIWRVTRADATRAKPMRLARASGEELVAALAHPNAIWRQTAQRLLVERGDRSVMAAVERIVREGPTPQSMLHALYTLDGLNALDAALVESAIGDAHFAVRVHALRLADARLAKRDTLLARVIAAVGDANAWVRLQSVLTLGESRDRRATAALVQAAAEHLDESWMQDAVMSSATGRAGELLAEILARGTQQGQAKSLLRPLCEMVATERDPNEIAAVLTAIAAAPASSAVDQETCLAALGKAFSSRRTVDETESLAKSPSIRTALGQLLTHESDAVNLSAYRLAQTLRVESLTEVKRLFDAAATRALDDNAAAAERLSAIELLTSAPYEHLAPVATKLLDAKQSAEIQVAAARAVAQSPSSEGGDLLLAGWNRYSPRVQEAVLDALFADSARIEKLIGALEKGVVAPASIVGLRRVQLLEFPEKALRARVEKLLATRHDDAEREKLLATYRTALAAERNAKHGQEVYVKRCANCHKVGEVGQEVGPRISSALGRSDESLLTDILDPSSQITEGYRVYNVLTEDGRVESGVLASESATSITLRREKGEKSVVLRKDIDRMELSGKSLMPEGMEKELKPADIADLLAYLREAHGPAQPTRVVLFDDEDQFLRQLTHGGGEASLVASDRYAGAASLRVTPPQRYAERIPGWRYPIAEHPAVGQYRYLRLAWKAPRAKGVMIELAADGRWPDAKSAARRYYSGKNATAWQARQVSDTLPREWTVITVDLWKDCGDFVLTGIAPTAIGGEAYFDRVELLSSLSDLKPGE